MPRSSKKSTSTLRGGRGGRGRFANVAAGRRDPLYATVGFSLADEARNTSQHSHWDPNSSLRQKPVNFVSAGSSEPLKQLEDDLLKADDGERAVPLRSDPNCRVSSPAQPNEPLRDDRPIGNHGAAVPGQEERPENNGEDEPGVTVPELEKRPESNEKDEPIKAEEYGSDLFFFDLKGGRTNTPPIEKCRVDIPERAEEPSSSSEDEVILFKGRGALPKSSTGKKTTMKLTQIETEIRVVEEDIRIAPRSIPQRGDTNPRKSRRHGQWKRRQEKKAEDDALLADYIANMRENGEMHDLVSHDAGNTRDLGGSADEFGDGSETGPGGATYHRSITLHGTKGTDQQASSPECPPETPKGQHPDEGDDGTSEQELDDETLAKLIAGQDLGQSPNAFPTEDFGSSSSSESEMDHRGREEEFDLMDWERPSLRRKKGKGARAQLNLDISDSELEQSLQAAWRSDRLKKSERKKQREELRALGMLGKKASKPDDLRVKYPAGMNLQQVAEELRDFLLGTEASLSLPPMDTHARKMIHDLANKFNVKSKSTGKADQRRPTLYRTGRTLPYVEGAFNQAVGRINRRYFPRLDVKGKRVQRPNQPQNHAAASYREGEVVGAAAPELGNENRGRAMLEKMGWSSGTALGALNNKGILQPVPQMMKKSRAGLG